MEVKIKKLRPNAVIPKYAKPGDAGMDLVAATKWYDRHGNVCYGSGIAIEIPYGYAGLVLPRSSNATKHLLLSNSVGLIDSGYRGEITAKFKMTYSKIVNGQLYHYHDKEYEIGERFAQLMLVRYPFVEFVEVDELTQTERGKGGYGSTGE